MATVSATASMGVKLKIFSDYENASTMASITIEEEVPEGTSSLEHAKDLYQRCRSFVQEEIEDDIKSAKGRSR